MDPLDYTHLFHFNFSDKKMDVIWHKEKVCYIRYFISSGFWNLYSWFFISGNRFHKICPTINPRIFKGFWLDKYIITVNDIFGFEHFVCTRAVIMTIMHAWNNMLLFSTFFQEYNDHEFSLCVILKNNFFRYLASLNTWISNFRYWFFRVLALLKENLFEVFKLWNSRSSRGIFTQ